MTYEYTPVFKIIDTNYRMRNVCGKSPVSPYALADALNAQAHERMTLEAAKDSTAGTGKLGSWTENKRGKLGCWVNGKSRFISRDHEAVHAYGRARMAERHDVWIAPVGSFVEV